MEAASRLAVLDLHRDPRRCLYLASSQRSGSTWLAQIIASCPGTRLVYEPANLHQKLFMKGEPRLVSLPHATPGDPLGEDGAIIDRAIDGSLQSVWANQLNTERRPIRRVTKDVRTLPVLPWIADRHPDTPIVLLLRHPMAVAHSLHELGWTLNAETLLDAEFTAHHEALALELRRQSMIQEVTLWAEQHHFAMSNPGTQRIHVIFYEHLVRDPLGELNRLAAYLSAFHQVWATWSPDLASIERPSATSYPDGTTERRVPQRKWNDRIDEQLWALVAEVLASRGLDGLYGVGPDPLTTGDAALGEVMRRGALLDEGT